MQPFGELFWTDSLAAVTSLTTYHLRPFASVRQHPVLPYKETPLSRSLLRTAPQELASRDIVDASYWDGYISLEADASSIPAMLQVLSPLQVRRYRPMPDDAHGCRAVRSPESLDRACGNEVWIEAGLFAAAYLLLARAGFHVSLRPPTADEVTHLEVSRTEDPFELGIAKFVNSYESGTLWLDTGVKVPSLLTILVRLFPDARIAIATQHDEVAMRIFSCLCRCLPRGHVRYVNSRLDQIDDCQSRVYVGRYVNMSFMSTELIDLFVPVDVQFVANDFYDSCIRFPSAKSIGIDFATRTHTDSERLRLAKRFGFGSLAIRHLGLRQRPTTVFIQPAPMPAATLADSTAYEVQRDAVDVNRARNHLTASLARFMNARHRARPPRRIAAGIVEAKRQRHGPRVLVVVESVVHAFELARLLPHAQLRFARSVDLEGMETCFPDYRRQIWNGVGSPKFLICTTTALRSVTRYRFDTVIMASGRRELPPDLWRLAYAGGEGVRDPLTVIDIAGPQCRRRVSHMQRLSEYAQHTRWQLEHVDQTEVSLRRLQARTARSLP